MDKKSNMKQAMFEMFGVGSDNSANAQPVKEEARPQPVKEEVRPQSAKKAAEKTPAVAVPVKKPAAASYLAAGTVLEGTLQSDGDIEIAGEFKGDITTTGTVTLHSAIQGNVTASSLKLSGCKLTGDIIVNGIVFISQDSTVRGNVTAKELQCAGQVTGDLKISENTSLESTAQVNGNVVTGSISVIKGAVIRGGVEIKSSDA